MLSTVYCAFMSFSHFLNILLSSGKTIEGKFHFTAVFFSLIFSHFFLVLTINVVLAFNTSAVDSLPTHDIPSAQSITEVVM